MLDHKGAPEQPQVAGVVGQFQSRRANADDSRQGSAWTKSEPGTVATGQTLDSVGGNSQPLVHESEKLKVRPVATAPGSGLVTDCQTQLTHYFAGSGSCF
jgi:hypothetical protein